MSSSAPFSLKGVRGSVRYGREGCAAQGIVPERRLRDQQGLGEVVRLRYWTLVHPDDVTTPTRARMTGPGTDAYFVGERWPILTDSGGGVAGHAPPPDHMGGAAQLRELSWHPGGEDAPPRRNPPGAARHLRDGSPPRETAPRASGAARPAISAGARPDRPDFVRASDSRPSNLAFTSPRVRALMRHKYQSSR